MTNEWPQRRKRPVFAIPEVPAPAGTRCVTLYVPDSLDHLAALNGALRALCSAANWANDPEHNAKVCADLWFNLLEEHPISTFGECEVSTPIFQQAGDCTLQVSYDDGFTWEDIFNAQVCADQAAQAAIDNAIDDGTLASGGQQSGQGSAEPEVCKEFRTQLNGNAGWLLPVVVSTGDTIEVTNAVGGWCDGTLGALETWWCPNGEAYSLGICVEGSGHTEAGDPLPSVNRGRLVVSIDGTWYDALDGVITVPAGVNNADVIFQMNDEELVGNSGSINVTVEVCGGTATITIAPFTDPYACATSGTVSNSAPVEGDEVIFTSTLSPDGFYAICQTFSLHSSWTLISIDLPAGSGDQENTNLIVFHGSHAANAGYNPGDTLAGTTQIGYSTHPWTFTARLDSVG